jgi:Fe-S-cluster containining protein
MNFMDAVRFTCQKGCTNCCNQTGFVYLTEGDVQKAAGFVRMSARGFEKKYVYRTAHELRFRKPRRKQCPFLVEDGCSIHPAKPTQCRTFPFWPELLENRTTWNNVRSYCPGVGKGPLIQIAAARRRAEEQRQAYPGMYE